MKVKVRKVKANDTAYADVTLAQMLARKISSLLSPQFDYIVNCPPDAHFELTESSVRLQTLTFENIEANDRIVISEETILLELNNGMYAMLCEFEEFTDVLRLTPENLYILEPKVQEYLEEQRQTYCFMFD